MPSEKTNITIRKAEVGDLPRLLEIYNYEVLNTTATFDIDPQTLEQRRIWFDRHQSERHFILAADIGGGAVGYASLSPYRPLDAYAGTAELSVYVDTGWRRQGIAFALMSETIRLARECGELRTLISVITSDNEPSIGLHERFGFRYCGTIPDVGIKFGRSLGIVNYTLSVI